MRADASSDLRLIRPDLARSSGHRNLCFRGCNTERQLDICGHAANQPYIRGLCSREAGPFSADNIGPGDWQTQEGEVPVLVGLRRASQPVERVVYCYVNALNSRLARIDHMTMQRSSVGSLCETQAGRREPTEEKPTQRFRRHELVRLALWRVYYQRS